MVEIYSENNITNANEYTAKNIFDKYTFKELVKEFHPDVNSGKAEEAFKRLVSLRKYNTGANSYENSNYKHVKIINKLNFEKLLTDNIILLVKYETVCENCDGIGYVSNNKIVNKCHLCNSSGLHTKTAKYALSSNGEFTKGVVSYADDGFLVLSYKNFLVYLQIEGAVVLSGNSSASLLVPADTAYANIGNAYYKIFDNSVIELKLKHSVFRVYAIT